MRKQSRALNVYMPLELHDWLDQTVNALKAEGFPATKTNFVIDLIRKAKAQAEKETPHRRTPWQP